MVPPPSNYIQQSLNILLLLSAIIIFLTALELTVRIFYPLTLEDTVYDVEKHYYHNQPNTTVVYHSPQLFVNEYSLTYQHNSKGFSDSEHMYENRENTTRMVALGDSFTEGAATAQNESFIIQFKDLLNRDRKKYDIINLGVGGTGIDNYYFTYLNEGRLYKPSWVFINLFIGNDITHQPQLLDIINNTISPKTPIQETSLFLKLRKYLGTHSAAYRFTTLLISSNKHFSNTLQYFKLFAPTNIDIYYSTDRKVFDDGMQTTQIILEALITIIRNDSVTPIIILIPAKEQVDDARYQQYYRHQNITPFVGQFEPQQSIMTFCKQRKINCIDLLPTLRKQNKNNTFYWNIDGHFNKEGHSATANIIFEKFKKLTTTAHTA